MIAPGPCGPSRELPPEDHLFPAPSRSGSSEEPQGGHRGLLNTTDDTYLCLAQQCFSIFVVPGVLWSLESLPSVSKTTQPSTELYSESLPCSPTYTATSVLFCWPKRITESQSIPSWKGLTRILKSNCQLSHRNTQKWMHISKPFSRHSVNSGIQGHAHSPGQPIHAHRPLVQTLSLTLSCPSPDTAPCRSLGPCHCHTEQSSALPLHPLWGAVAAMRPPLSYSALGWTNRGPQLLLIPFTIFVALLWMLYIADIGWYRQLQTD